MKILMDNCHCSVEIKNLEVRHGKQIALHNVSLTANHGETLALIGQNGAGKTTLLKAIINSVPFRGAVNFFDSNGKTISNPKIGYVPQRLHFDKSTPLTVMDLFCTGAAFLPIWLGHSRRRKQKALEILKKVGAEKHINKQIGRLSGGELQRVLLAFALEPMPDILLLDEPVAAVDRKGISALYSLINSMRKDYHMPIIIVSHDLAHISKYATSYALIDHTVIEYGKVEDMIKSQKVREIFGLDFDGSDDLWT